MAVEDEIKSKKIENHWQRATVNIVYTSNWVSLILDKRAGKRDITLQQFNVLRILRGQLPEAVSNGFLKSRMITNTPDISRMVDRMQSKGLVERGKSVLDRRAVAVRITDAGLALLDEMEEDMMLNDILPEHMTVEEFIQLSYLLDKFRGTVDQ